MQIVGGDRVPQNRPDMLIRKKKYPLRIQIEFFSKEAFLSLEQFKFFTFFTMSHFISRHTFLADSFSFNFNYFIYYQRFHSLLRFFFYWLYFLLPVLCEFPNESSLSLTSVLFSLVLFAWLYFKWVLCASKQK